MIIDLIREWSLLTLCISSGPKTPAIAECISTTSTTTTSATSTTTATTTTTSATTTTTATTTTITTTTEEPVYGMKS